MRTLLLATLILFLTAPATAQESATSIEVGQSVKRTLSQGERHRFTLDVSTRARYSGFVDQLTTDVVIEIYSPSGELIESFDDTGAGWHDPFDLWTTEVGQYSIEVIPFGQNQAGDYAIVLESIVQIVPIETAGTLAGYVPSGGAVLFEVALDLKQVLRGSVDQSNLDVIVHTLSSAGDDIAEWNLDSSGQERFVLRPDSSDTFFLQVSAPPRLTPTGFDSDGLSGTFSLTVTLEDRILDPMPRILDLMPSHIQVNNLALLGRVWGFLKYHHPAVTTGQYDWDAELLRAVPSVIAAESREDGRQAIFEWASATGPPPPCNQCAQSEGDVHLPAPSGWVADAALLGPDLAAYLSAVFQNRYAKEAQYYLHALRMREGPRIGLIKNEASYDSMEYPDAGYRLLALFRYWNVIEYFFPYRDIIGEDWRSVLTEFIPRLLAAGDEEVYHLELMALVARVKDSHASHWSPYRPPAGECGVPAITTFVDGQLTVYAVPQEWDVLEVGDVIVSVDDEPVTEIVDRLKPYYGASNEPTRLRDIGERILRGSCGATTLVVDNGTEIRTEEVSRVNNPAAPFGGRYRTRDRAGDTFQLLSDDVAYLKLSSVTPDGPRSYVEGAIGTKGWVLDLRGYPSAPMVFSLGQHFVSDTTPFARFSGVSASTPGVFAMSEPVSIEPDSLRYEGKIVILVSEVTQSQAEYTAMAFRAAPGSLVVGSTTAGADGNITPIPLPGGQGSAISGIGVFYPDKTPTQRVGIIPDVYVEPTVEGIRAGRDEVLEAALRVILGDEASDDTIIEMARRD